MVSNAPTNMGVKIAVSLLSILLGAYREVGLHSLVDDLDHFLRGSLSSPVSQTFAHILSAKSYSVFLLLAIGD